MNLIRGRERRKGRGALSPEPGGKKKIKMAGPGAQGEYVEIPLGFFT